ncbi:MAG: hypothetical protein H0V74_08125, partial [Chloroflexi bacterium]|nr:hypothetical protein [Chloroflexota bacterium]
QGLAGRLLAAHLDGGDDGRDIVVEITVGERDVREPLDPDLRASVLQRLLVRAGFEVMPAAPAVRAIDPGALTARRAGTPGRTRS